MSSIKKQKSKFDRVLGKKDVFSIAFGAMIGWSWVVMAGQWILKAGTAGAMLAFVLGGIMIMFVGLTYAELTSALPQCGGEQIFSLRALGPNWSFLCTWAIILGYVGVVAFEACALPTVLEYIAPGIMKGYMYTVEGFDIYAVWVAIGVVSSIIITIVNYVGVKPAAYMQGVFTFIIVSIGVVLIGGSAVSGDVSHTKPLFDNGFGGLLSVAVMTPFMFVGFDVIPQAAEEIAVPFKQIGKIILISIGSAIAWYALIIFAVSLMMTKSDMQTSVLITADAMKKAYGGRAIMADILIIGGMAGILSSWNSFFMGGSRAIYALAEAKCLPAFLTKIHPKYKTPSNAILLIGAISCIAPFFGRAMMEWLTNAGGIGAVTAYLMVSISFLVLRKKEPGLARPYKVKNHRFIGGMAILLSSFMLILYMPGMPSGLSYPEWMIIGLWTLLGVVFYAYAKRRFPEFGRILDIDLQEINNQ
ncbi:APC family permease [Luxibacter massiliensis]|uniref:APC family permease n=1 Tax=Luxibacter massiliensis TaxID=2219695 RepID=UPI001F21BB17|nr:APC family permease [Luxibacter massiliensis]